MKIKAIFYDLDGTLRMNEPRGWDAFSQRAKGQGLAISPADMLRAARWEHYYFAESPELHADQVGYPDSLAFWTNYSYRQLQVLGASEDQARVMAPVLHQEMAETYHPTDVIPEELWETLKTLRVKGYLLGVFSNRKETYQEYVDGLGLGAYFDLVLAAGEAGRYKPDPGAFEYMLARAGVTAAESIYVGDNYYADVVGARSAGLKAVLFDRYGVFEEPDCPVITAHSQLLPLLDLDQ